MNTTAQGLAGGYIFWQLTLLIGIVTVACLLISLAVRSEKFPKVDGPGLLIAAPVILGVYSLAFAYGSYGLDVLLGSTGVTQYGSSDPVSEGAILMAWMVVSWFAAGFVAKGIYNVIRKLIMLAWQHSRLRLRYYRRWYRGNRIPRWQWDTRRVRVALAKGR